MFVEEFSLKILASRLYNWNLVELKYWPLESSGHQICALTHRGLECPVIPKRLSDFVSSSNLVLSVNRVLNARTLYTLRTAETQPKVVLSKYRCEDQPHTVSRTVSHRYCKSPHSKSPHSKSLLASHRVTSSHSIKRSSNLFNTQSYHRRRERQNLFVKPGI